MGSEIDKREEGLRALARMIANSYRRRMAGEIAQPVNVLKSRGTAPISENEIIAGVEYKNGGSRVYTETVRVENFLRKKSHQKPNKRKKP
jgi:hypothetical protein